MFFPSCPPRLVLTRLSPTRLLNFLACPSSPAQIKSDKDDSESPIQFHGSKGFLTCIPDVEKAPTWPISGLLMISRFAKPCRKHNLNWQRHCLKNVLRTIVFSKGKASQKRKRLRRSCRYILTPNLTSQTSQLLPLSWKFPS